ncbi:hypothetical protein [Deinococcus yunweiensis]|uniref:hypothetical protein n=1 Tax=Deinococcus yunweiensis TaxID=367282 RepID=UPI00398F6441
MRTLSPAATAARLMDTGSMLGPTLQFWKGRTYAPVPGDSEATLRYKVERLAAFQRDLTQAFVPAENMIRGVVKNATDHVLGSEPTWNLTGTDVATCEKILTPTWNDRDLHGLCQQAMRTRIRDGEGALRLRIPRGAVEKAKAGGDPITAGSKWLRFEALTEPERLTITEDEATLTLRATLDLGRTKDGEERGTEEAFIDAAGYTVLQLRKGDVVTSLWRLNLGGRLPYIQIQGEPLITQGMVDNQAGANMVMTASINNSELAGQIMEHFHNMQPQRGPDKQVQHPDGSTITVPGDPLPALRGPGGELYTNDTVAVQTVEDDRGSREQPVILEGKYTRHGPVSSEPLDFTLSRCEYNIYAEAKQRHYLMADKASATGEARKTAMASFFKSLAGYRRDAVKLLRSLIETTHAMSYALCQQAIPEIEVEPVLTDRLVDPSPEERAADREDVKAGILPRSEARARQGYTNSEALQKQINKEQAATPPPPAPPPPDPAPSP